MLENNKRIGVIVVTGILLIGNVFFGLNYFIASKELKIAQANQSKVEINGKVVDFASLFIKKVLQADKEVDFETRLSLENAVRGLKDEEIMAEWTNFVGAKTETSAQESVKKLLGILIDKIQK